VLRQGLHVLALTALWLGILLVSVKPAPAQDLEARRWSHLPTGLNILGFGAGATDGEITFDPVAQIEDGTFRLYSVGSSYVRSFELLGRSSRLDIKLPYVYGRWEGLVGGEFAVIHRAGFGDPRLRFSMLLYGSPPLSGTEYMQYRAQHPVATTVGAAVTVVVPWGEYFPDRLINLGANRFVIRPSLGLVHRRGPWEFESTASLSLYQDNDEYYPGDSVLERDPLWFLQGHVTRNLAHGQWITVSGGLSYDGEFVINGVPVFSERTTFVSLAWGVALTRQQSIRVAYVKADTQVVLGADTDNLLLSWSVAWSK